MDLHLVPNQFEKFNYNQLLSDQIAEEIDLWFLVNQRKTDVFNLISIDFEPNWIPSGSRSIRKNKVNTIWIWFLCT